jgi:hypothetical protein
MVPRSIQNLASNHACLWILRTPFEIIAGEHRSLVNDCVKTIIRVNELTSHDVWLMLFNETNNFEREERHEEILPKLPDSAILKRLPEKSLSSKFL